MYLTKPVKHLNYLNLRKIKIIHAERKSSNSKISSSNNIKGTGRPQFREILSTPKIFINDYFRITNINNYFYYILDINIIDRLFIILIQFSDRQPFKIGCPLTTFLFGHYKISYGECTCPNFILFRHTYILRNIRYRINIIFLLYYYIIKY